MALKGQKHVNVLFVQNKTNEGGEASLGHTFFPSPFSDNFPYSFYTLSIQPCTASKADSDVQIPFASVLSKLQEVLREAPK